MTKDIAAIDLYQFDSSAIDINKVDRFFDNQKKSIKASGKSKEEVSTILRPTIDATRSDSIVNARCYAGYRVNQAIPTWTKPYAKPVLPHHRSSDSSGFFGGGSKAEDALGRVHKATFRPFPGADLRNGFVSATKGGAGSGQVLLEVDITNSDAQEKILDRRYLTVSTSQGTTDATCSICGSSLVSGGCSHRPGRKYPLEETSPLYKFLSGDAKKKKKIYADCFSIWDQKINFREVSFVNIPAQQYAGVLSTKWVDVQDDESLDLDISQIDIYDGTSDHVGVISMTATNGLVTQELFADDWFQSPSGLYVSAPAHDYEEDEINNMDMGNRNPPATQPKKGKEPEHVDNHSFQSNVGEDTVEIKELEKKLEVETKKVSDAEAKIKELSAERDSLKEEIGKITEAKDEAEKRFVDSQSKRLFDMYQTCGIYDKEMSEEDTKEALDELAKRSLESLSGSIEDLSPKYNSIVESQTKQNEDEDDSQDKDDEPDVADDTKKAAGTVEDPTVKKSEPVEYVKPTMASALGF